MALQKPLQRRPVAAPGFRGLIFMPLTYSARVILRRKILRFALNPQSAFIQKMPTPERV